MPKQCEIKSFLTTLLSHLILHLSSSIKKHLTKLQKIHINLLKTIFTIQSSTPSYLKQKTQHSQVSLKTPHIDLCYKF